MCPNDVPDREALNRTYHEAQSQMELLPNYYRWIYGYVRPHMRGTVIELGCGAGLGIRHYIDLVDRVHAVDYNQIVLKRVAAAYARDKVCTHRLDLTHDWDDLLGLDADVVLMMDVLEHFKEDRAVMGKLSCCLKPGGLLAVKVPAQAALFSDIDMASGHYRRYDRTDLAAVAEAAGFETLSIRPINPIGALAYRLKRNRRTNFSKTFSPSALRLINTVIPALSLFDHLRILPGQSWIGLFRRAIR